MSASIALTRDAFMGQIAALEFINNGRFLVAATGPYVKVYEVATGRLLADHHALPGCQIVGIRPDLRGTVTTPTSTRILVFGSKCMAEISVKMGDGTVSIMATASLGPYSDWIKDVAWVHNQNFDIIAIVFAHNFLQVRDISALPGLGRLMHTTQCTEKCILYSARIQLYPPPTLEKIVTAVGTVFNEVHEWSTSVAKNEREAVVTRRCIGHEGVIFNLRYSRDGTKLASVSDDRTARIWSLQQPAGQPPTVLYGHLSRVWDCVLSDDDDDDDDEDCILHAVTVSEDTSCRVWNVHSGQCITTVAGHAGKSIWSVALSNGILATGGSDHGICVRDWTHIVRRSRESTVKYRMSSGGKNSTSLEPIARIASTATAIFAASRAGDIYSMQASHTPGAYFLPAEPSAELHPPSGYTVLQASTCATLVVCADMLGAVSVFTRRNDNHLTLAARLDGCWPGKIFSLSLAKVDDDDAAHWRLFVVGQPNGELCARMFSLSTTAATRQYTMTHAADFRSSTRCGDLPAATSIASCAKLVAVGMRNGSISLYAPTGALLHTILSAHHSDAVSDIVLRDSGRSDTIRIYSCGRDGYVRHWAAELADQSLTVQEVLCHKSTKGWLERIIVCENGDIVLGGFWDKKFFARNDTRNYEIFAVACGGGNRPFTFERAVVDEREVYTFTYLRSGVINQTTFVQTDDSSASNLRVLHDGGCVENGCHYHGRETRCICRLEFHGRMIYATGGEDCLVNFYGELNDSCSKNGHLSLTPMQHLLSVGNQSSCITDLSVVQSLLLPARRQLLFSCGGCEDIRVTALEYNVSTGDLTGSQLSVCPFVSDLPDTRVMSLAVSPLSQHCGESSLEGIDACHVVSAVYSDFTLRLWIFDERRQKFFIVGQCRNEPHQRCFLLVGKWISANPGQLLISTADTGGYVTIWDVSADLATFVDEYCSTPESEMNSVVKAERPTGGTMRVQARYQHCMSLAGSTFGSCAVARFRHHQSGVKAYDMVAVDNKYYLATGGDDNSVCVAIINSSYELIQLDTLPAVHASSVQAVKFVRSRNTLFMLSVSLDRRLTLWRLNDSNFSLCQCVYIDVADVAGMCAWTDDSTPPNDVIHVALTGAGFSRLTFTLSNGDDDANR